MSPWSVPIVCPEESEFFKKLKDLPFSIDLNPQNLSGFYLDLSAARPMIKNPEYPRSSMSSAFDLPARKTLKGKKEVLFRAIGSCRSIWDVSAGLGRDALMLQRQGYRVQWFERNPLIFSLLIFSADTKTRDQIHFVSETQSLAHFSEFPPEVVYYDPMYAKKRVKSAVGLESAWLQSIVGSDTDSVEMSQYLRGLATKRLVIKRAIKQGALIEPVSQSFLGTSTRYDMYLTS